MLCLECGKREAKYDGLCEECFLKKVKFTSLPKYLEITMCPHCHAIKLGSHWEHISMEEAIRKIVEKSIVFEHEYDSYSYTIKHGNIEGNFEVEVEIEIKYGDLKAKVTHLIEFHVKYESCPRCNRFFGNYFEAIIQLRDMREGEEKKILDFTYGRIEHYARKNENLFLTKEVEKKEGWDLYLSDKKEAKKIAKEICHKYGATLKESPQIAGRKDGRDLYRVTYAVRFPPYRIGDIVEIEGNYYVVEEISDSFIRAKDITTGKRRNVDSKKHRIKMVEMGEEIESAMVIYSHGNEVQLMDKNNKIIEVVSEIPVEDGKSVRIVRIDDVVYIVP